MSDSQGDMYQITEEELQEISQLIHRMDFIRDCTMSQDRISTTSDAISATFGSLKDSLQAIHQRIIERHQMS